MDVGRGNWPPLRRPGTTGESRTPPWWRRRDRSGGRGALPGERWAVSRERRALSRDSAVVSCTTGDASRDQMDAWGDHRAEVRAQPDQSRDHSVLLRIFLALLRDSRALTRERSAQPCAPRALPGAAADESRVSVDVSCDHRAELRARAARSPDHSAAWRDGLAVLREGVALLHERRALSRERADRSRVTIDRSVTVVTSSVHERISRRSTPLSPVAIRLWHAKGAHCVMIVPLCRVKFVRCLVLIARCGVTRRLCHVHRWTRRVQ